MNFRFSLLASVSAHLFGAFLIWVVMGGRIPWHGEMVIDLTGSFRTREASSLSGPGKRPDKTVKPETNEITGQAQAGISGESPDSDSPMFDLTKLPELADRDSLRDKLERYYPPEARRAGEEGLVMLEVVVSSSGRIIESKVLKSEPMIFAESAIKICQELLFSPAYLGSRPVAVKIRLPIRFELEKR